MLAVPAVQHFEMARQALLAGKHVFVEKPLTLNLGEGERLVALAAAQQRTLMVGHLLEYHPAVTYLKSLLGCGDLGALRYIYAQRLNLGVVRQDENAMWSLAPHDISVMLYLLGCEPEIVAAHGVAYLRPGVEDVVFLTLRFPDNHIGHIHVSWLDPHKVRRLTLVGTHRMAEFDDMESSEKVRIYDHGVGAPGYSSYGEALTLRFGDIVSPRLDLREPAPGGRAFCPLPAARRPTAQRRPGWPACAAGADGRAGVAGQRRRPGGGVAVARLERSHG